MQQVNILSSYDLFFYQIIWVITMMNILPQSLTLSQTVRQNLFKSISDLKVNTGKIMM